MDPQWGYKGTVTDFDPELRQTMDKLAFKFANSHQYDGISHKYMGGSQRNYANMHEYRHIPNDLRIGLLGEDNSGETEQELGDLTTAMPGKDEFLVPVSTPSSGGVTVPFRKKRSIFPFVGDLISTIIGLSTRHSIKRVNE